MNTIVRLIKPICSSFILVGLSLVLVAGFPQLLTAQSPDAATAAPADAPGSAGNPAAPPDKAPQAASAPSPSDGFTLGPYQGHTEFEVGYRWSSDIKGNDQMYRSQVNLFQGARLLSSYLSLRAAPGTGAFDRLDLSLNNWGDPYNSLRLNIGRADLYDLRASYRNLNYYNFISSFANPLLSQGNSFAQHNLNVDYRMSNVELRLFPNSNISPFVGYSRNSGSGPGFTTVQTTGNEFLLNTRWLYTSDEYRGGFQFNFPTFNLTLEQGYRSIKNDTSVVDAGQSQGNQGSRPFLGQVISLDSLNRGYHGRVKLPTSRVLAKFSPLQNLHMVGRYIYTMGSTEADLGEIRSGNFVSLEDFLIYGTAADSVTGRAKKPNHNGSFLIEYVPVSRLRLTDTVDTFDYHISGSALMTSLFLDTSSLIGPGPTASVDVTRLLNSEFVYNQVRNQLQAELGLGAGFSFQLGHRFTYVKATNDDSEEVQSSDFSRHTAILGLVYRPERWMRVGVNYENNQTNSPLTRTSPFNYDQINVDFRVGSWKGFSFNGRVDLRGNKNTAPDIDLRSHDRNYIAGLSFEPNERISLSADYSRTNIFSDLLYVMPQNLRSARSLFDERISGIGGRLAVGIYRASKVEVGYRGIINRGTAPIEFHQPYASIWVPLPGNLAFKPTWQYFGYTDDNFGFESYKTHLVTFSLVYSR